jgi:hypothetical protein
VAKVFLSYRHEDKLWTKNIQQALAAQKVRVLWDNDHIKPGDNWRRNIQDMIDESQVALVIIGNGWLKRVDELSDEDDYVRKEIIDYIDLKKPIIPILADGITMKLLSPLLPEKIRQLFNNQAKIISIDTFDEDIKEIKKSIKELVQEYRERVRWVTLNGLRGILKLALRDFIKSPLEPKDIQDFASVILTNSDNSKRNLDQELSPYQIIDNNDGNRLLRLNGITYKTLELKSTKSNSYLEIGIHSKQTPTAIVIYEQLLDVKKNQDARLVVMIYSDLEYEARDYANVILLELNEPMQVSNNEYRLPYKSVFTCRIKGDKQFSQSYRPANEKNTIDMNTFVDIFKMNWIGTVDLSHEFLQNFHKNILNEYGDVTIIHAIEYMVSM